MIEIGLVWLLIGGELLLVLSVALAALLVSAAMKRKRDREAAMHLIKVVKEGEAKRKEDTAQWLQNTHGLSGEALERNVHDMVQAEKLLVQRVVNMYVKRDRISLRELNIDIEAVGEPFRKLDGSGAPPLAAAAAGDGEQAAGTGNDAALRAENEALKQELQITMETMSRMLSEYASMFGSSQPGGVPAAAMEALDEEEEEPAGETLEQSGDLDDLEGLDELEDLGEDFADLGEDLPEAVPSAETSAVDASDETVEIDLSDDDIANLFGSDDDLLAGEPKKKPQTDAEGNEMDDDLADMWADALGEQDPGGKP